MRWNLHSNVGDVLALGPRTAGRLATVGIRTVAELLEAQSQVVARRLHDPALSAAVLHGWQCEAHLILKLPELPTAAVRLLAATGITSVEQISSCTPTELLAAIEVARRESSLSWFAQTPLPSVIEAISWIQIAGHAQKTLAA